MLSFDDIQTLENISNEVGISRRLMLMSLTAPVDEKSNTLKTELLTHTDDFIEYLYMMLELAQQAKEQLSQ